LLIADLLCIDMDATLDFHEKILVDTPAPTHVKSWLCPAHFSPKREKEEETNIAPKIVNNFESKIQ
jgi:hypothetical protein